MNFFKLNPYCLDFDFSTKNLNKHLTSQQVKDSQPTGITEELLTQAKKRQKVQTGLTAPSIQWRPRTVWFSRAQSQRITEGCAKLKLSISTSLKQDLIPESDIRKSLNDPVSAELNSMCCKEKHRIGLTQTSNNV